MLKNNMFLQEAVDKVFNPDTIVTEIKKCMNQCKLTKFKSKDKCDELYSKFFLCETTEKETPTTEQWGFIYNKLMVDPTFNTSMCYYVVFYHPSEYRGIFKPFMDLAISELGELTSKRVRYLSSVKASVNMLYMQFDSIRETLTAQLNTSDALKFIQTILAVLSDMQFKLNKKINTEIDKEHNPDDISYSPDMDRPMEEDAKEYIKLLESAQEFYDANLNTLDENIINDAKERAKAIAIKSKKTADEFDHKCAIGLRNIRENRRNKKHAEIVGESLRINREIKRLLAGGSIALIINPVIGAITYITSIMLDRATDKKDRDILLQQLTDEIEIVDEKISQAERNGDDKAKVDLMRMRQKMTNEYKRIRHVAYEKPM